MTTIDDLRKELQRPRRHKDTWYGKYVMRRLSIYITAFLAQFPVSPFWVNFVSILSGLLGAWLLSRQEWLWGILFVNGWYLLDHVDGELARFRKVFYATGLYFDSMANVIVIPAAFAGLGVGLKSATGAEAWLYTGFLAAYSSLMLFVVPYCEAGVILQRFKQGRLEIRPAPADTGSLPAAGKSGLAKRTFSQLHTLATFPVFLPLVTALILAGSWAGEPWLKNALKGVLVFYAAATTGVWVSMVAHAVLSLKIDKKYPPREAGRP